MFNSKKLFFCKSLKMKRENLLKVIDDPYFYKMVDFFVFFRSLNGPEQYTTAQASARENTRFQQFFVEIFVRTKIFLNFVPPSPDVARSIN